MISPLVMIFESLDFSANRVEGDDLLGDASEYLMRHFATDSGKSKGQFYTPAEVFTWGGTTISFLARPWQSKSIHQIGTTPNWETVPQPEITHSWGPSVLLPLATAELA